MELSKIGEIILSKDFFLNTAILTVIIRVVWFVISELLNKIRWLWMTKRKSFIILLASFNLMKRMKNMPRFYCLIIRYGTDHYIKDMANDREKYYGRLQNKIISIPVCKDKKNKKFVLKLNLPVHKRLGTQFKCFAEVQEIKNLNKLCSGLNKCPLIFKASVSSSQFKNRVYFLIKDFGTVQTVGGIENNMCYPV